MTFYLASHDFGDSPEPRKCRLADAHRESKDERLLCVRVDNPIPGQPYQRNEPITEFLLAFCDPADSIANIGKKPVVVDILIQARSGESSQSKFTRIGTGTLHASYEEAVMFSPIEKNER